MPCFKPLSAWRGEFGISGKRSVVFKSGEASPALSVFEQKLPCGQCIGCRLDYALDWAVRCTCEVQVHERSCFITLTYDPDFVPSGGSLSLRHWQLFMKDLRRLVGPVRHFHAGEYGSMNGRPHDHALLFGYDFPDRKFLKTTDAGSRIYTSDILSKLWGKGFCCIGDANFESAGYLARYLIGRPTLRSRVYGEGGEVLGSSWTPEAIARYGEKVDVKSGEVVLCRRPEYLTMSRRPGIAYDWFKLYRSDVFPRDYMLMRGGFKMPPPRYFDSLYELENPVDMARIKRARMARCGVKEEVWNKFLDKFQL